MKKFKIIFLWILGSAFLIALIERIFSIKFDPLTKSILMGIAWYIGYKKQKQENSKSDEENNNENNDNQTP